MSKSTESNGEPPGSKSFCGFESVEDFSKVNRESHALFIMKFYQTLTILERHETHNASNQSRERIAIRSFS
jgi:hypothetical protein